LQKRSSPAHPSRIQNLQEKFGLKPDEQTLVERTESIVLRLGATWYVRKNQICFIDTNGTTQLMKLELQNNGRITKAFTVYVDTEDRLYKQADELYADVLDSCLTDVKAVRFEIFVGTI